MADYLAQLSVKQVEAWYRRLVAAGLSLKVQGHVPYAAQMLETYLNNRRPRARFKMPVRRYLVTFPKVTAALTYHRDVFLSRQDARVGMRRGLLYSSPITKTVGVVPRLTGNGYPKWDLSGPLPLNYHSLVQIDTNSADAARIQYFGTPVERDLFGSLRGFQLHSDVVLRGRALNTSGKRVRLDFESWYAHVEDRYDWNYAEHLTVNNPNFQSPAKDAVRPQDRELTIYHINAKRLEDAGLAAPYNLFSDRWRVTDPGLVVSVDISLS